MRVVLLCGEAELERIRALATEILSVTPEDAPVLDEPLTAREVDVLDLLAEGLPNKVIAARLSISEHTVKFHVSAICGKLGAENRTDAVRRAVRRGLVTL